MQIELPADITDKISDRCIRCYKEQYWYGENYLFDLIKERDLKKTKILEIGCAEGGLLKFFHEKGAECSGIELSDVRYGNAIMLDKNKCINFFQADICDPDSYESKLNASYDLIIIRDVIEHIANKEIALKNLAMMLKAGGEIFMSFPPKYCAYAGHQQTAPSLLAKIPYIHLLPDLSYTSYLKLVGCKKEKIDYLIETKKTRISITGMKKIVKKTGLNIKKQSSWFIRPAYKFRFGIPKLRNPFSFLPIFNEIFSNGVSFLMIKKVK